jgi:hypothetical protein
MATTLTAEEYEERRKFIEELKILTKPEQVKLFQILKEGGAEFSENSNGIFFDVAKVSPQTFRSLQAYMEFCKCVRKDQAEREKEMDELREEPML